MPGETLGLVRAAASSASHSFLEVLLGTRRFGTSVCGGLYPVGAAVAGHPRFAELPWLAFVSSSFSFGWLCCSPQQSLYSVLVAWEYKAGGNPFSLISPHCGKQCFFTCIKVIDMAVIVKQDETFCTI